MKKQLKISRRFSRAQKAKLVAFMVNNPSIARGHASTSTKTRSLWMQLVDDLNDIGGPTKGLEQWRKCWIDFKTYARRKHANHEQLDETEAQVVQLFLHNATENNTSQDQSFTESALVADDTQDDIFNSTLEADGTEENDVFELVTADGANDAFFEEAIQLDFEENACERDITVTEWTEEKTSSLKRPLSDASLPPAKTACVQPRRTFASALEEAKAIVEESEKEKMQVLSEQNRLTADILSEIKSTRVEVMRIAESINSLAGALGTLVDVMSTLTERIGH